MKARSLSVFLALVVLFPSVCPARGEHRPSPYDDYSADAMAIDALIARPLCLVATVIGTGLFAASLPVTLISGSTRKAAKTLVGKPAHFTFTRKLGDLSSIE